MVMPIYIWNNWRSSFTLEPAWPHIGRRQDLYHMSYLRAGNQSYCSFITQSMPSGIYRNCWVNELNHVYGYKVFSQQPFLHPTVHMNMWKLYNLKLPTRTHPNWGVDGNGNHWKLERVTWILHRRKIPTPALVLCPGEQTTLRKLNETCQAHNSGFHKPAVSQALCVHSNHEWHRNWGTAGLLKATHTSRERLNRNSSQIASVSVFILFPLHHSNFQETLNI